MTDPVLIVAIAMLFGLGSIGFAVARHRRRRRTAWRRYVTGGGAAWRLFQRRAKVPRLEDKSSPAGGGGSPQG